MAQLTRRPNATAARPVSAIGSSAACDICFTNIQVNDQFTLADAFGPLQCRDSATGAVDMNAMYCKACATETVNCLLDCYTDRDCYDLTNSVGLTATCIDHLCGF